jgi:cytochrome c oxidase cbb3-type subunit 3
MTTNVRTRLSVAAGAFAFLFFLASGCNSSKPVMVPASTSPNDRVAVGPVPGGEAIPVETKNPYSGNAVAIQDGRRLFDWYNCSGCHGGHGGGGMGPSLRDETWLYGSRDDQIYDSIAAGRSKGMPSWGSKIPQNQIWELVAYLKTMRTSQEPDPPLEPAAEEVQPPTPEMPSGVPLTK